MKKITVIFSTYNGERTLRDFLDSLTQQTLDQSLWKVVAVNNNSTDNTQSILEEYADRLPLQILFEERQGKTYAIDQGFQHIEGDLLVLTDDDVTTAPDWLENFLETATQQPDYNVFSGLIKPNWEQPPADWITAHFHPGILYALNEEFEEGEIKPYHVSGPNSAFRTNAITSGYIVDERLGPNKEKLFRMGEDTLFASSIGDKAYHTRRAAVSHFIPKEYLQEKWIFNRAEKYGKGSPIVHPFWFKNKKKICGRPISSLIKFCGLQLLMPVFLFLPKSKLRSHILWNYYLYKGLLSSPI